MEKETFFGAGDFLNLNWDHPSNHTAQLESALSSLVSSPASNSSPPIRELIGRFGGSQHVLSPEEDSVPRPAATTRKRKSAVAPKGKGKETTLPKAEEDSSAKKSKSEETAEPPKQDYIHVRARRGQATDSHSLAERVRREKISERMKFLQDLVPGCNKVTGKAVMLDEIINYVQSLQRQVEFLSMKLSTVNPDTDSLFAKEAPRAHSVFPVDSTGPGFSYGDQPQFAHLQSLMANGNNLGANIRAQFPNFDGFMDSSSQLGAFWEDDLQSVVQMGFGQSQDNVFSSQAFQGSLPTNHMKVEL